MNLLKYILIFGAVSSFYSLQAQYYSNVRMKKVPGNSMKISLDSLAIVPNSVNIYTSNNRSIFSNYRIDEASGMIEFGESIADSLTIFYRVYDFKIKQRVQSVLWNKREEKRFVYTHTGYTDPATTSLLDFDGLNYSGSFTRGIMFGNTQGLALSSGFNLGLSGKTAQGIEISANLSDANIPIQPDGNTAQVNEFDRIFIKVKKDNHAVIIGDYDLEQSPNAYFLNFNRKLQGLQYMGEFEFRDSVSMKLNAAGAITRGQFTRNELQVQENNQGPYKLRGANNEIFLIVLGNSERVFVNGQLMERGFDKDYTIDYNLGEITFTPRRIITRDLRVFVEFQYSDKNYFRTTLYGNNEIKYRNFSFALNAFSEQDNKSQPLNFNLDDSKIKKLSSVGDNLDRAIVPSSTRTTNDGTKVLYRQIDTIVDFVKYDSIYILGTYNDSNLFQVSFSFVGANKGNYIVLSSAANGRVYGWKAPLNGVPQGDYEPVVLLITPKSEQLFSATAQYDFNKHLRFHEEFALSNRDLNTYSDSSDADNVGFASKSTLTYNAKEVNTKVSYEWVQNRFKFIQRYRNIEFARDWDIANISAIEKDEHLIRSEFNYIKPLGTTQFGLNAFLKDSLFKGYEMVFKMDYAIQRSKILSNSRWMIADQSNFKTSFFRPQFALTQNLRIWPKWSVSAGFNHEIKRTTYHLVDTLDRTSFLWQNYTFQFFNADSNKSSVVFQYIYRTEQLAYLKTFASPNIYSHTASIVGKAEKYKNHLIRYQLTYRNFFNADTIQAKNELNHYYLGKVDYRGTYWNGLVKYNMQYNIGAGREQRIQFTYVQAPNGYGAFAWKDINGNGIFELNEAFVSQFNYENRYMKLYLNTPEFVPINDNSWTNIISISPKNIRGSLGNWELLKRLHSETVLDFQRKIYLSKENSFASYFDLWTNDKIVGQNTTVKQTFSINRDKPNWNVEYEYYFNKNAFLLSNGIDARRIRSHTIKTRLQLSEWITWRNQFTQSFKVNTSEFFKEKNFDFIGNNYITKLIFQTSKSWRFEWGYDYKFQSNKIYQFSTMNDASLEVKWNQSEKSLAEARFDFITVGYSEIERNPQVEFAMLGGIQKGNNYVWSLTFDRRLSESIQLNIVYQGRKNNLIDGFIHSLSAEIRATF